MVKADFADLKEKQIKDLLDPKTWTDQKDLLDKATQLQAAIGKNRHDDYNAFEATLKQAIRDSGVNLDAKQKKQIIAAVSWTNPDAEPVIKKVLKKDEPDPTYGMFEYAGQIVQFQRDSDLRDSEDMPLSTVLTQTSEYDLQGRLAEVTSVHTNGANDRTEVVTYDYDSAGNRVAMERQVDIGSDGSIETHTDDQIVRAIPPLLLDQAKVYANLATAAYDREDWQHFIPKGWARIATLRARRHTGYFGRVFRSNGGETVVAYAGTDDWPNWQTNFIQGTTGGGVEYDIALEHAQEWMRRTGGNVHFVGHSLGGGLATAAALTHNRFATTFNAAGLHSERVPQVNNGNADFLVNAFRVQGDPLSTIQDSNFSVLGFGMPDGLGNYYWLPSSSISPLARHSMDDVLAGLNQMG